MTKSVKKCFLNPHLSCSQILVQHNSGRLDQYYPLVVIHALMNILNNPALAEHHSLVIQTVITVFQVRPKFGKFQRNPIIGNFI